jgi:hypothetical protein
MHLRAHDLRWLVRVKLGTCALLAASSAQADPPLAQNAMPGIHRTGFVAPMPNRWVTGALTAGYGYTEPQGGGDGGHHRQLARAAIAAWPVAWLGAGLRLDERYDYHPKGGPGRGSDDGWMIDPMLALRAAFRVAESVHVGPDLSIWLPGNEHFGDSLDATTVDARLLATASMGQLYAGALVGYRLDRSGHAGKDAARLAPGDRLALGLSDFDAWLLGAGASYAVKETLIKGEVTADLLFGSGAPSVSRSPWRAAAGVERIIGRAFSLEALVEFSLSARPPTGPGAPLVPVEPRITGLLGLHYRPFAGRSEPVPDLAAPPEQKPPTPTPAAVSPPPAPPTHSALDVALTDDVGQPIPGARLTLEAGGQSYPLTDAGQGKYHLDQAPVGSGKLHTEAPGFLPIDQTVEVTRSPANLEIRAQPALPSGQVRGLVRSFRGKPVSAKIRIEPSGAETTTDKQGFFQVDVQPGEYEVVIEAAGFTSQRRRVNVQERGVVVLNADLVEAKP